MGVADGAKAGKGLQQMHLSDQQLSEGFESNQTIIQQGPYSSALGFSLRPTDFAPRALLRTHLLRKLPEAVDRPVDACKQLPITTPSPRLKKNDEGTTNRMVRTVRTPWEEYESNRDAFRLVYCRRDSESVFGDREEDFTGRQMPLKHLLRYQQQNYALLRPHEPPVLSGGDQLVFDSRFECGNLFCAFQSLSSPCEYHLFMENDTNRFGYNQWFYFSLAGATAGTAYRFKVVNFRKASSFFKIGMRPVVFSLAQHTRTGNGWSRCAENVVYGPSPVHDVLQGSEYKLYCLSFDLHFTHSDDFITVSSGLPYSYSRLTRQLRELKAIGEGNGVEWSQRTIAYSLSNNQVPYLVIRKAEKDSVPVLCPAKQASKGKKKKTHQSNTQQDRPIILIMARQHPGETHSSFLMEEILRQLANSSKQAKSLLQEYEFHVFPMVNVDGVIYGNFRCDLAGFDLNRAWRAPLKEIHPQVFAIGEKVRQLAEGQRVAFCFDLHSHSKQFGVFSYCCKEDEVQARVFPLMLAKANEHFLFPSCTFGLSRDKLSTARAVIASLVKHHNVLTVQASSFASKNQTNITVLQPVHFRTFAKSILQTLLQYLCGGQVKKDSESEVKTRLAEFQDYERQNEEISGSDSEGEIDPREHLKHLRSLLPENTLKKLERKCVEIDTLKKSFTNKDPPRRPTAKFIPIVSQPTPVEKIDKPEEKESRRYYPKVETRKQQVLAILRTKEGLKQQPTRKAQQQPVIRMPMSSFKVNLARYEHTKTENLSEKDAFLSEEQVRLLEHPARPSKNRSSLILGSAHRDALKATHSKAEHSRFKQKSFEEEGEAFERVGDRRNLRKMSKVEKILRLRKRANTLKNIHCQERMQYPGNVFEIKIGDPEAVRAERSPLPFKSQPGRLKLNKSSTTINRVCGQKEKERERASRKPSGTVVTNHPNAQTSLIGQLWRINYGRYSKELS